MVIAVITDHKMRARHVQRDVAATSISLFCQSQVVIFSPPPPFFSPFYRFISFILTSSRLLCAVLPPSPLRPYSPLLSFLSLSVTHSTSLIQQLECTRTHSHTHTHTCPHTPVSNLYEMIPNAFGSPWEFPL